MTKYVSGRSFFSKSTSALVARRQKLSVQGGAYAAHPRTPLAHTPHTPRTHPAHPRKGVQENVFFSSRPLSPHCNRFLQRNFAQFPHIPCLYLWRYIVLIPPKVQKRYVRVCAKPYFRFLGGQFQGMCGYVRVCAHIPHF